MRRPRDFWKSALCAQFFCFFMYMLFGLVCYLKQGQYSSILPGLDFQNNQLILANNIIGLISTMVAAVLYGNIGVKVFYENVLRAYFKAPSMMTSNKGRLLWSISVTAYWVIAWVIGSAIPNLTALITLVGSAFILQFTYTFPPVLLLGYWMQRDAMKADSEWRPGMAPGSTRIDTWKDLSRWKRGFKKYWYIKLFLVSSPLSNLAHYPPAHTQCLVPHASCCMGQLRAWNIRRYRNGDIRIQMRLQHPLLLLRSERSGGAEDQLLLKTRTGLEVNRRARASRLEGYCDVLQHAARQALESLTVLALVCKQIIITSPTDSCVVQFVQSQQWRDRR